MSDAPGTEHDNAAAEAGNGLPGPLGQLPKPVAAAVVGSAVALVALTIAAQRDVARRDRALLRGPRWLWRAVASTPVGVVAYGMLGIKQRKPPFPSLPAPKVVKPAVD